jgi:hypothetical protein
MEASSSVRAVDISLDVQFFVFLRGRITVSAAAFSLGVPFCIFNFFLAALLLFVFLLTSILSPFCTTPISSLGNKVKLSKLK